MTEEKEEKIVIVVTNGDHEHLAIAMVMANASLAMDVQTKVILQGDAVMMANKGEARHVNVPGFAPLEELIQSYEGQDGKMYVCTPCCETRKIGKEDLIACASMITSGFIIDEVTSASAVLSY